MPKIIFEQIPGLIAIQTDLPFEITFKHDDLDMVRAALTIENKAVAYQISRAKKNRRSKIKEAEAMEEVAKKTGKIDKSRYSTIIAQADRLGAEIEALLPDLYKRYWGDNDDGTLNAPAGFAWMADNVVGNFHLNTDVPFVPWPESTGKSLRPYQEEAVKAALQYKRSSIVLPTGAGKTICEFALANCYLSKGKRVCILEPTIALVKQMKDEADLYFTKVSGLGGDYKYKPDNNLLISTVQSAGAYIDRYDVVIVDEMQHSAATTIEDTLFSAANAEYCHGFTACPVRADNMTLGIHAACGRVVLERDARWAIEQKFLTPPNIVMIQVKPEKRLPDFFNAAKAYSRLCRQPLVTKTLLSLILKAVNKGRRVLVVMKTVEESFFLQKQIESTLSVLVASSEYRSGLYKFKAGEGSVLIANSGLLSEGIDIPSVDALINTTQFSSENMARQILGRGLRLKEGKKDLFFCDVTFDGYSQFERAYFARKNIYLTVVDSVKEIVIGQGDV